MIVQNGGSCISPFRLLIGLFVLDNRFNISTGGHEIVQIGSLLLILFFGYIWIKANSDSLSRLDQRRTRGRITGVLYLPENRLPLEKNAYAGFKLRNSYVGNRSNIRTSWNPGIPVLLG